MLITENLQISYILTIILLHNFALHLRKIETLRLQNEILLFYDILC